MSYLDDTIPADTEAVRRGASRIRDLKTSLNTVLDKIFDSAGAFLDGWLTTDQIEDGAVTAGKLASNAVTTTKVLDAAITAAKLSFTVSKIAVGTYSGSASAVTVTGLGFAPDAVVIARAGKSGFGVGYASESGPIHPSWGEYSDSPFSPAVVQPFTLSGTYLTALAWAGGGFTVSAGSNFFFNTAGATYYYIALKA